MSTEIGKIIDNTIKDTFIELKNLYKGKCNLRIIFPQYSSHNDEKSGKLRVSEQELRFALVEQLVKKVKRLGWYYSVETPTYFYYKSARNGNEPCIGGARSGHIDMTIYDEKKCPVAFIEFKSASLRPNDKDKKYNRELKYDIIKLIAESQYHKCLGYSLHLIEKTEYEIKEITDYLSEAGKIIKDSKYLKEHEKEIIETFDLDPEKLKETVKYTCCLLE